MINIFIVAGCLIPGLFLAYTDYKERMLYNKIVIPIFLAGLMYAIYIGNIANALLGAGLVFAIFLFVGLIWGGIGGGDIKLSAALGIWFGFPAIFYIVIIASLLGLIWDITKKFKDSNLTNYLTNEFITFFKTLWLRTFHKIPIPIKEIDEENKMDYIPYGTFLILGAWILWGFELLKYF